MTALPPDFTPPPRYRLASLGRHLHCSVLRLCMPQQTLRDRLGEAAAAWHAHEQLVGIAARHAAEADALAMQLSDALDLHHAGSIARFSAAQDALALQALWRDALGTPAMPGAYWALLTHPHADRALRHLAFGDVELLAPSATHDAMLPTLLARRSISPRRLGAPAPTTDEIDLMLQAALAAPDHGRLHPWRVIEFREDSRARLADLFEQEKRGRDPLASAADLRRAREHATQPPGLLAFVVSLRQRKRVPLREQWLAAGAALGNLLNAAHAQGYGAIVLSGDRCYDADIGRALGLGPGEVLAGFVSLGTATEVRPPTARALSPMVWSCWTPPEPGRVPATRLTPFPFEAKDEDIA